MSTRPKYKGRKSAKRRKKPLVATVIPEPARTSLYDVVENNLKIAERVIFIHRFIYIGEHTFPDPHSFSEIVQNGVNNINSNPLNFEQLTGVLLYYERYFCHIIEGDEITLVRHLKTLLFEEYSLQFKYTKLLSAVYHIGSRFSTEWVSHYGRPAILVESIDPNSNLETTMGYVKNCACKLYKFANLVVSDHENPNLEEVMKTRSISAEPSILIESRSMSEVDKRSSQTPRKSFRDPYRDVLPELKLLEFLLHSRFLVELTDIVKSFGVVSIVDNYRDKVWPVPTDFIPYNVFTRTRDPVTDFPTKKTESEIINKDYEVESATE